MPRFLRGFLRPLTDAVELHQTPSPSLRPDPRWVGVQTLRNPPCCYRCSIYVSHRVLSTLDIIKVVAPYMRVHYASAVCVASHDINRLALYVCSIYASRCIQFRFMRSVSSRVIVISNHHSGVASDLTSMCSIRVPLLHSILVIDSHTCLPMKRPLAIHVSGL